MGEDRRIAVIGLGYVGLPLALAACEAGLEVVGLDADATKIPRLARGESPLRHIDGARIRKAVASGRLVPSTDFDRLRAVDAVLICVPTPLGRHREPDLSFVEATARAVAARLRRGQLVVLESTTYPGTTREVVKPILEATGLRSGADFHLAYSPEREDPGNPDFTTARIPRLVGGDGEAATRRATALYRRFVGRVIPVSSPEVAEAAKIFENVFRAVNIALVNEFKMLCRKMGLDVFEVIEAAATKPFGFVPFWPGPGLGGHCIPVDPFYLAWRARAFDMSARFVELAGEINAMMPDYVVGRLAEELDRRFARGLNGARVLLVGMAYKRHVDDVRESPAFAIWRRLAARGARVCYHDPHVPEIPRTRGYPELAGIRSVPLDPDRLGALDAAVVVTDHDAVDWARLVELAPLVLDTRGRCRRLGSPRVVGD